MAHFKDQTTEVDRFVEITEIVLRDSKRQLTHDTSSLQITRLGGHLDSDPPVIKTGHKHNKITWR